MATVFPRRTDPQTLRQRLAWLRRAGRWSAFLRGASQLLIATTALVLLLGFLDYRVHLPALVRAIALVGVVGLGGLILVRRLIRPLRVPDDDLSLALRIEDAYPGLNDALASAVQFLDEDDPSAADAPLKRETVRRVLGRLRGIDFDQIVDRRGIWLLPIAAIGLCLVAVGSAWLQPTLARIALARLVDPFGVHDWPKRTRLTLETPRSRIGRNEAYEIRGELEGVIPEQATVVFHLDRQPPTEQRFSVAIEDRAHGKLSARLDAGRVLRSFRFQVFANDATSEEYQVEVLPPPQLAALDGQPSPQVRIEPPAYADLPSPVELPAGTGNLEILAGTRVTLRAAVDRPIARAWIEYQPEPRLLPTGAVLAPLASRSVLAAIASLAAGDALAGDVPAILTPSRDAFGCTFVPWVSGLYVLHFEDETGLRNSRVFELRVRPDPVPLVQLERPSPSRDVLSVTVDAVLGTDIVVEDAQYAIRSVTLNYRTGPGTTEQALPLHEPAPFVRRRVAPWAGPASLAIDWRVRPSRLEFHRPLVVADLRHADGSRLRVGDVVTLYASADDFDDVDPTKLPGRSHEVELRIVDRNALDLILNQKQAEVQQELLRLREKQRDAMERTRQTVQRLKRDGRMTPDAGNQLLQTEQVQQQIRERIGEREEGLRGEARRVLDTLRQNRLRDSAVRERMRDVLRELDRLAEKELPPIEPRLASARRQGEMLGEEARAARQTQLREQARETERRAAEAEQIARARTEEAAQTDERAVRAANEADREREKTEARRLRAQADDLRQRARDLLQQAARERQEADQPANPDRPREDLQQALAHQEEIERTFNDLLTRLEPWSNTREIKGEAGRLLQEQQHLQDRVQKLQQELPPAAPSELPPRQRGELEDARAAQQRLEERARQLLDKIDRLAKQRRKDGDPDAAADLESAHERGTQDNITGQMKTAREQIEANRLGVAARAQEASARAMQKLLRELEDRREAELDRLAKKLRAAERRLDELADRQDKLSRKISEAGKVEDPEERAQRLRRLAKEQEQLREDTEEAVQELTRLRAGRAAQAAGQAVERMSRAGQRLAQGQKPDDEEPALDRLEDAQRELARTSNETEEELGREQMARAADAVRRLGERQEALVNESKRIQQEVLNLARKSSDPAMPFAWPRQLRLGSWSRLGEAQQGLAVEVESLAVRDMAQTPVFRRMLERAAEAMSQAARRIDAVKRTPPPLDAIPDSETARWQQLAQTRLRQLASVLGNQEKDGEGAVRGGSAGEPGDGSSGRGGDDLPPEAQLKLLRALQVDLNQRTAAFLEKHPDASKLDPGAKAELDRLRQDQQEIAELLDALTLPPEDLPPRDQGVTK